MRITFKITVLLIAVALIHGCRPLVEEDYTDVIMDLNSPEIRKIYELQDQLKSDSLIDLLGHQDATFRYWASRALGSVQAPTAVNPLLPLLQDTAIEVRQMTAYALGQIGSAEASEALVQAFDQKAADNPLNYYILQAIGKAASPDYLPLISAVTTYQKQDTHLLQGQAECIYYYMLRGITDKKGTARMLTLVNDVSNLNKVRLYAANYLFRAKEIGLDTLGVEETLASTFSSEQDPNIRMALAIALGNTKTLLAQESLVNQYQIESDYRVKCNIIRALSNFDYKVVKSIPLAALRDPNLHIANTAVQYLGRSGSSREANIYRRLARDTSLHPQVQIGLLNAANMQMPNYFVDYKSRITTDLRRKFENTENPYHKAQALRAMGHYIRMYAYIGDLDLSTEAPIVQTAQMEALKTICEDKSYDASLGSNVRRANRAIGDYLLEGIKSGDAGKIAVASAALRIPERDFKTLLADSVSILENALSKLQLPQKIESYNELKQTIASFKGTKFIRNRPAYNHPIDWSFVDQVSTTSRAVLQSSKGAIRLRFFPDIAPASVANFIQLAQSGYFDGKNFHRVVSNFVAQGGCNRGDGYGAENYSIRSEFSPDVNYERAGMIGMASAGKHTEGTQFFITHSPTLHLNGNYTIFAEVVDGMKIVDELQEGDIIEKVSLEF